jgi:FMN phosphatase YigB (HAD superfamily)
LGLPAIFFDIGDTLVSNGNWLDGAERNLEKLNSLDIALGIISNTGTLTREELKRDHLPSDFDFGIFKSAQIILSSEFGSDKSTPEIFLHAIAQAQRSASDCLFVGENLAETWMAQSVGMRSARVSKFPDDLDTLTQLATTA